MDQLTGLHATDSLIFALGLIGSVYHWGQSSSYNRVRIPRNRASASTERPLTCSKPCYRWTWRLIGESGTVNKEERLENDGWQSW